MISGCSGMTWEADGIHLLGRTVDRAGTALEHRITAVGRGGKCAGKLIGEERCATGCLAYAGLTIDVTKYLPNAEKVWIDGINERGVMMALFNFSVESKENCDKLPADSFHPSRIIPHILSRCETVEMAASVLERLTADDSGLPMQVHFLIYDVGGESVVAEPYKNGFKLYRHTDGVLTNEPEFTKHMENWRKYRENQNLSGDFSSESRFIRLMHIKSRAVKPKTELEAVSKMLENLSPVTVPDGLDERKQYRTMFKTVMSAESRIYYVTAEENHRIKAVKISDLHNGEVKEWSVDGGEDIDWMK